jgi:hypothetical protein
MLMISELVVYAVTPIILVSFLVLSVYVTAKVARADKVSTIAGFYLGLVVFVTYERKSLPGFGSQTLHAASAIPAFELLPTVAGCIIGFGLLLLGRILEVARRGLVGLVMLFLVASSSTAIYSYFFNSPQGSGSIDLALGCMLGILIFLILVPQIVSNSFHR